MRNISFSLTTPQFIAGIKDVTRRVGWLFLKAGDELCAIEKGQGLGKGEKVKRLGKVLVASVRYEPLRKMTDDTIYGLIECNPRGFLRMGARAIRGHVLPSAPRLHARERRHPH